MAGTQIYGQLIRAQAENSASDLASPAAGTFYWNTTSKIAKLYSGTAWKSLLDTDSSQVVTNKDIDGGTASNTSRITVPKDTNANLTALTRKQGTLLYDTDANALLVDDGSALNQVGTGSSGRNYLSDWFDGNKAVGTVTNSITATGNITISTTVWKASDTSKLTVTTTTSSPLRQTSCLLLDHIATGAAFVQTPCFLLDSVDLGKPVSVSFDVANIITSDDYQVYAVRYNSSGTYQEQIPIAGTASATSPYSARIPTGTTTFRGFFISGSTSTDYYVIRFYRNSASDATDIKVDSLYAGPQSVIQGNAVGQPIAFPIASAGGLGTPANVVAYYQQVGKYMEVTGSFNAGTVAGTTASLPMPSGLTIDTAYLGASSRGSVGKFWSSTSGSATFLESSGNSGTLFCDGSDGSNIYIANKSDGTGVAFAKATGTGMSGNGAIFSFVARIPISQWSSNVTMADRVVEEYVYTTGTWDADSSTTGYGSSGTTMGGALTAARTKTMTLQTVTLPTDRFFLEYKDSSSSYTAWQDAANLFPYVYQNTTEYGARIVAPTGSSTIQVVFNQYRRPTGATYGSAGESWGVSLNWRVRKVSGGAAVGFPIGARNIVGDTSGTTVPAGYIGEKRSFTARAISAVTSGWTAHASTLDTLPTGIWMIYMYASITAAASATMIEWMASSNSSSDSTGNVNPDGVVTASNTNGLSAGGWTMPGHSFKLEVTTTQALYAKAISYGANRAITISGHAVRIG